MSQPAAALPRLGGQAVGSVGIVGQAVGVIAVTGDAAGAVSVTLEQLTHRVAALEHELAALKAVLGLELAAEFYAKLAAIDAAGKDETAAEHTEKIGTG
jgi:hypothetical protein